MSDSRTQENFCFHTLKYAAPEVFEYYYQQHREACFLIPDRRGIENFYLLYKVARQVAIEKGYDPRNRPTQYVSLVKSVAIQFEELFADSKLDKTLVLDNAEKQRKKLAAKGKAAS